MEKLLIYISIFLIFFPNRLTGSENKLRDISSSNPVLKTVIIDPGHGGKDPGAVSGKAREKDIVLDIALKLGNHIKNSYPDVKIIYTRDRDIFVPLFQRAAVANKNKADLFISIHVNSVERGTVQGTETYILGQHRSKDNLEVAKKENSVILLEDDYHATYEGFDPNSPESYIMFELVQDEYLEQSAMFASMVQDQFRDKAKRIDRSVKQAGFLVLRQTAMPGILIEAGFINHPAEREYLMSSAGREHLASAIFNAFSNYKNKIEARSSFNLTTESSSQQNNESTVQNTQLNNSGHNLTNNIFFSVQIASLSSQIEINSKNFKNENKVFMIKSKNSYKYYCGEFRTVNEAQKEQKRLRAKFKDAFVVAFENNRQIPVEEAIKKL